MFSPASTSSSSPSSPLPPPTVVAEVEDFAGGGASPASSGQPNALFACPYTRIASTILMPDESWLGPTVGREGELHHQNHQL